MLPIRDDPLAESGCSLRCQEDDSALLCGPSCPVATTGDAEASMAEKERLGASCLTIRNSEAARRQDAVNQPLRLGANINDVESLQYEPVRPHENRGSRPG